MSCHGGYICTAVNYEYEEEAGRQGTGQKENAFVMVVVSTLSQSRGFLFK